jgi:alpha-mannosidase
MSLVDVVDEVLALLDADADYRFTLDGQLATVDDYLAIRPENEERLRDYVQAGRLAVGPWQTLVDEFLVSGETIVRNLERGLARAADFGDAMRIGYLPDSFGHVAQMPQILRLFGIEDAVVWRGVPAAIHRHAFRWEAPDGSAVRAEYLPAGYSNAAHAFDGPEPALDAVEHALRPWYEPDPVLAMVGTDHMPPVRLPHGVPVGTLRDYLAAARSGDGATAWRGELRSGARANLLPGCVSARIDLKRAAARAERALERYAEPLQALYGDDGAEPFLREAWTLVLQNAAHDSICGCSADEVSAQVLVRYTEAEQIGRELARRAVDRAAAAAPRGTVVVVNPSPRERADLVELDLTVPPASRRRTGTCSRRRSSSAGSPCSGRGRSRGSTGCAAGSTAERSSAASSTGTGSKARRSRSTSATSRIRSGSTWSSSCRRSSSPPPRGSGRCASSRVRDARFSRR